MDRRTFLKATGAALGALALSGLPARAQGLEGEDLEHLEQQVPELERIGGTKRVSLDQFAGKRSKGLGWRRLRCLGRNHVEFRRCTQGDNGRNSAVACPASHC